MSLRKTKHYQLTKFSPEAIREAFQTWAAGRNEKWRRISSEIELEYEGWDFDNDADFFSSYKDPNVWFANYSFAASEGPDDRLRVLLKNDLTSVSITLEDKAAVEQIFDVFEKYAPGCRLPEDRRDEALRRWLRIFIGHGHNPVWRDLKDHLSEKHAFKVKAYETGARAGHHIVDILKNAQRKTGFAVLVMTAENQDMDNILHARENVIHEIGLFQGKLGTERAIVLLEEGCIPFSNLAGVQYIPFSKGNIKETFGEILATIRREFGPKED
jgi:predicted nucleotide-binding protein